MATPRIYLDTSVLGGCFDPEFAPWSRGLIDDIRAGRFTALLSELIAAEVAGAPANVQALYATLVSIAEACPLSDEAMALADRYANRQILPARFRNDMLHIAIATTAKADILVSWNFRHIVRFDKIQQFNTVNVAAGFRPVAIYSPREVATYEHKSEEGPS